MTNPIPSTPFPVFRAFSTTGQPLAGGQLFTYAGGTTTPLASYTDSGGGTPNANPVVLDSTGSAPVFLNNVPYKLVLKDSNGVTQWVEDNVFAPPFVSAAMAPVVGAATTAAALAALGGVTAAVVASMISAAINNYLTDTGAADAYVVALTPPITSYVNGLTLKIKITGGANTLTDPTLTAGGGAKTIYNNQGGPLAAGDIKDGVYTFIYDTTLVGWYIDQLVYSQLGIVQPRSGFAGLELSWRSTSTVLATAKTLTMLSASGQAMNFANYNQTLNTALAGAGGLDTGSMANSTWYYVWAIYNPATATQSIICSTSSTTPTLPSGYTFVALIGAFVTDGSANIIGFVQYGEDWQYLVGSNLGALPLMASGSAGSVSVPTWAAVALGNFLPLPGGLSSRVRGSMSSNTNDIIIVAPNNSYGAVGSTSNPPPLAGTATAGGFAIPFDFLVETSNIYWANNGTDDYLRCTGFRLNI